MRVAVINEISARDKNPLIMDALAEVGVKAANVGMKADGAGELTYIQTGLMAAIILNLGAADMVVGGCGTGQGFLISAMQYPKVFCGLISEPLDAWLFAKINAGNCVSLPLNKGFGWAGGINLKYIFEKLFSGGFGEGYPAERCVSQKESRGNLLGISRLAHLGMEEILEGIKLEIAVPVFSYKPFSDYILSGAAENTKLLDFIKSKFLR
ncbi:MAG TPA: RpiB/LacA/LacB family sugar-phosphate isomerase [Eubacteriales bacterium]|nr:RpiB/LacA/LacB family sugar-phosphate isomerase [Clostridia bacterium]HRR89593.1 RpiB/LacA/LacB family sugar-phosphate isomerase [Eubacteriales bacterium]HRU84156.1 RpiB/LacA/LacB family sugar-phosphate isomerase [Eubacteriales bacterium]